MTVARYAHVTAAQERDAAELLDQALIRKIQSVTQSVRGPGDGVVWSGTQSPTEGIPRSRP